MYGLVRLHGQTGFHNGHSLTSMIQVGDGIGQIQFEFVRVDVSKLDESCC